MQPFRRQRTTRQLRAGCTAALATAALAACSAPAGSMARTSTPYEGSSNIASGERETNATVPSNAADDAKHAPTPSAAQNPPPWAAFTSLTSNAGGYVVHLAPAPSEIPDNEAFSLRVWVSRANAPQTVADGVTLAVDAAMPEHGHGMNRTPRIARAEDGGFVVDGLLFHMTGHWELYFDLTAGALTERAQTDVVLE